MFGFGELTLMWFNRCNFSLPADDAQQAHQDVYGQDGQPDNQATYTGEALGGAAGFEAMRQVSLPYLYWHADFRACINVPRSRPSVRKILTNHAVWKAWRSQW